MSICLPVCLPVCPSAYVSVCLACLSTCLSHYLYVCLSVPLSICLSACLPVCLSACLSVYLSICLSACLSVPLSICLSACLSVSLFICLSACLSLCLSICLPVCLPKQSERKLIINVEEKKNGANIKLTHSKLRFNAFQIWVTQQGYNPRISGRFVFARATNKHGSEDLFFFYSLRNSFTDNMQYVHKHVNSALLYIQLSICM